MRSDRSSASALARLRYREAAGHFANAAVVLPQTDEYLDVRFNYLSQEADALYKQGDELGDNAALRLTIDRRRSMLELQTRERVPLDWAQTQTNLGLALWRLGERESGTARLEEAVAAYRAALADFERAAHHGLGLGEAVRVVKQKREIVEVDRHCGMIGAQALFVDFERAAKERLGLGEAVRVVKQKREVLRLAASTRAGTVAPSALMRRLAAYPRQNALAKALREIGCIERTLFTLDWITDPALRRRSNAGLNKGEARNALARAVFFHRHGEIRDRTFENQSYRASGLNLAVAAVILWNTVYLGRAVAELCSQGEAVPDELLAHIAHHLQRRLHLADRASQGRLPASPKSPLTLPRCRLA